MPRFSLGAVLKKSRRSARRLPGGLRGLIAALIALLPSVARAQSQPDSPPTESPSQPGQQPAGASESGTQQPPPGSRPPPHYYVEPAPGGAAPQQAPPAQAQRPPPPQGVYEPPPPGYGPGPVLVYEPPPPPTPRHIAPKYSLWLGARLGWFVPFGNAWARSVIDAQGYETFVGEKWSDYGSSGPMFELDGGARLGRNYNLFLLWERAALGASGRTDFPFTTATQDGAESDFYAIGLRVSSNPDHVGFLTEIAIGARRFKSTFADGTEVQLTNAPFEARLGLGADIRLGPMFSLSPLVTLGVGSFGQAEIVHPNGTAEDATGPRDEQAGHGWITLQLGGHFDIAGGG